MSGFEIDPSERIFVQTSLQEFAFLREEFGFEMSSRSPSCIEARSSFLFIEIEFDDMDVFVTLEPLEGKARIPRRCRPIVPIGVNTLVECMDPSCSVVNTISSDDRFFPEKHIPQYASQIANLVRNTCVGFLRGDFQAWPSVGTLRRFIANRLQLLNFDYQEIIVRGLSEGAPHLLMPDLSA